MDNELLDKLKTFWPALSEILTLNSDSLAIEWTLTENKAFSARALNEASKLIKDQKSFAVLGQAGFGKKSLLRTACAECAAKLKLHDLADALWECTRVELHNGTTSPRNRLSRLEREYIKVLLYGAQNSGETKPIFAIDKLAAVLHKNGVFYNPQLSPILAKSLERIFKFNNQVALELRLSIVFLLPSNYKEWPSVCQQLLGAASGNSVSLAAPTWTERRLILEHFAAPILCAGVLDKLADVTAGFPVFHVCRCASLLVKLSNEDRGASGSTLVEKAASAFRFSSSEFELRVPKFTFSDVIGLDKAKTKLRTLVESALLHPEKLRQLGLEPPRGILLYGPPNTGKSMLCEAVCGELPVSYLPVSATQLLAHSYVGQVESKIRLLFQEARQHSPCVLALDNIEILSKRRSQLNESGSSNDDGNVGNRVLSTLLNELDGIENRTSGRVLLLACTNKRKDIDEALLRPKRLDQHIKIDYPSLEDQKLLFKHFFSKVYSGKHFDISESQLADICKDRGASSALDMYKFVSAYSH